MVKERVVKEGPGVTGKEGRATEGRVATDLEVVDAKTRGVSGRG